MRDSVVTSSCVFANTSGVVLRCLQREMGSCPHSSLLLGHLLLLRGGVLDLIDLSSSMLAPTVMTCIRNLLGNFDPVERDALAILAPFQLRAGSLWTVLETIRTVVLPFIIGEMVAGCVGVGSVSRTAPVAQSFEDPLEE